MSEQRQQQKQVEQGPLLDKYQVMAMGGTLLTAGVTELATHNPAVIAAGILATIAAGKLTPVFRETIMGAFVPMDPDGTLETTEKILNALPIKDNSDLPQDPISKVKRLFNIKTPEPPAQPKDARDDAGQSMPAKKNRAVADKARPSTAIPATFMLDDVLDVICEVNDEGCVYFGCNADENPVAINLNDMYHALDVSSSGKGKSNRFRLIMMQVVNTCEVYYVNPLANNVKPVKDERRVEVWKPIFDRLANGRPMKTEQDIATIMNALVTEIANRQQQEAEGDFSWQDRPVFVFIDELSEVFALCPAAIKQLDKVGRLGRQFCVFCWVGAQSAAVEDIGQSTAAQAQYKTRVYGGGDRNSSNRMMKGSIPAEYESLLQTQGAGLTLMLAEGFSKPDFVRAPLVTNEALFDYLGEPPFNLADWLPQKKAMPPMRSKNALDLSRTLSPELSQTVSRDLSHEETLPIHAQNTEMMPVKGESRERVKGPNEEAILEAIASLEDEEKTLTLNAIAKKAGLSWRAYDEIEAVAIRCGHDLAQGKGRPAEK